MEYNLPKSNDQKYHEAVARNLPVASAISVSTFPERLKYLAQSDDVGLRVSVGIRKHDTTWDARLQAVQAKAKSCLAEIQAKAAVASKKESAPAPAKAKPALFTVEKKPKAAKKAASSGA